MRSGDPLSWPSEAQMERLEAYARELATWNARVNLIARGSESETLSRHVRHCLALLLKKFPDGATIVDWGTGGGLPAAPLAIMLPKTRIVAVDSIAKKTAALKMIKRELDLDNLDVWHGRAEHYPGQASHFVSRATAPLRSLWKWTARAMATPVQAAEGNEWSPGLICLKGGDLAKEIRQVRGKAEVEQLDITSLLNSSPGELSAPFQDKYILHAQPIEGVANNS